MSIVTLVVILTTPTLADDATDRKREVAERYVRSPAVQDILNQMLAPQNALAQILPLLPIEDASEEDREILIKLAYEEFVTFRPQMEEALITAAAETFTEAELIAATRYYQSKEGRGLVAKQQDFSSRYLAMYAPIIEAYVASVEKRVEAANE
ncbi:MAG: hypothetical protein AAF788_04365 [Pseudomonadota bacterium]